MEILEREKYMGIRGTRAEFAILHNAMNEFAKCCHIQAHNSPDEIHRKYLKQVYDVLFVFDKWIVETPDTTIISNNADHAESIRNLYQGE